MRFALDRRWRVLLPSLFAAVRLLILAFGFWLGNLSVPDRRQASNSGQIRAESAASWMDQNLASLGSRLGMPEGDLHWSLRQAQESEGECWDMRVVGVTLLEDQVGALTETLDGLCETEEHSVKVLWVTGEPTSRTADIWVDGFLTHRIFLYRPPRTTQPPEDTGASNPRLALIVDDLGNTYQPIRPLFQMGAHFTVSIFPQRPYSKQIAAEARSAGIEVMMHLPMEPWGYPGKDPGVGALLVDMSDREMERVLLWNIQDMPYVMGMNNHMGSRLTESRTKMMGVMRVLKSRNLYFVDSMTTPRSVGYHVAKQLGVVALKRDVFLDVVPTKAGIHSQFNRLLRVADLKGHVVGICHPYPETIQILPELFQQAEKRGYEWVTVSQLGSAGKEEEPPWPMVHRKSSGDSVQLGNRE